MNKRSYTRTSPRSLQFLLPTLVLMFIVLSGSRTPGHAEPEQEKENARPQAPSSGCTLEISGPEIICNGETTTFTAEVTGNTSRCEHDPESNFQWSSTFNKLEVTPKKKTGSTYTIKAVTDMITNGQIIADHPCSPADKTTLTLNGDLLTSAENSKITAKAHGVSIDELRQLLLRTADPTFVFSRRNRRNLRQKIEENLRATNVSDQSNADPGHLARKLVPRAIEQIRDKSDQFRSSLRSTSSNLAGTIMTVLSDDPPAFSIWGQYTHRECSCDPGNANGSELSNMNGYEP